MIKKNNLLITFVFILISVQILAQDKIYFVSGNNINVKIIEETADSLKYKNDLSTELKSIDKQKVSKVVYLNGDVSIFVENKNSKNNKRRGFIGGVVGISNPIGKFAEKYEGGKAMTGIMYSINMGYKLKKYIGLTASLFRYENIMDQKFTDVKEPWKYSGVLVGPLLTYETKKNIEIDIRAMMGYVYTNMPNIMENGENESGAFAYSLGVQLRSNIGDRLAILFGSDYFSTTPEFKYENNSKIIQVIESISFNIGLAYRI
ncbi:MAG: hypothetical protein KAG96_07730 [Ichthyobacteriaceae bacterium]|nr:hypothetical protein [Ichthyobacteriaceae bacterium]